MKAFYLTFSLLIVFMDSHAETCYVQQANPESAKKYHDSAEIIIEQNGKDVEVALTLPSEMEEYALERVSLVIKNEINNQ